MKVNTMSEAWKIVGTLFPYSFRLDDKMSEGNYPIYRPVGEGHDGAYIKDFGNRLVMQLEDGARTIVEVENERSISPAYLAEKSVKIFIFDHHDDYVLSLNSLTAAFPTMYIEGKIVNDDERVPAVYHGSKYLMIYIEDPFGEHGRCVIRDMRRTAQL